MILICYDGSEDARAAINRAAELAGDRPATVLTIWQPFINTMAQSGAGLGMAALPIDTGEMDSACERAACERAQEGTDLARSGGLNAQPRTRVQTTTMAEAILSEADDVGADLIVLGSRGLTGLKSLLLGSVSHALLQHADRSVLVVPSPKVVAERAEHRHKS